MVGNLRNADESLAERVANGLGIALPAASKSAAPVLELPPSPALRIIGNTKNTLVGRTVGILIHDGSDGKVVETVGAAIRKAGGTPKVVAPKVGTVKLKDGSPLKADMQLAGAPSVLFDAVALVLSAEAAAALTKEAAAVQFVMDAFGHLKAIGYAKAAQPLLDKAGVEPDEGVVLLGEEFVTAAKKRYFEREPKVRQLA
jgi:catalase